MSLRTRGKRGRDREGEEETGGGGAQVRGRRRGRRVWVSRSHGQGAGCREGNPVKLRGGEVGQRGRSLMVDDDESLRAIGDGFPSLFCWWWSIR
ncbi:hypothetical protein RJT34_14043 [Clitoria ternatea]|uniref:Uncharacterized protein n=1 Tax=Clitoria ternatea TaxID=43366 RepID=A0AAN9JSL3_CLITE